MDADGKVDYRGLEDALGGMSKDLDYFLRELHMARGAILRASHPLALRASPACSSPL